MLGADGALNCPEGGTCLSHDWTVEYGRDGRSGLAHQVREAIDSNRP
jgi:hypothetical protein